MDGTFGYGISRGGEYSGSRCARFSALTLVALAAVFIATPVWAQRYRTLNPRMTEREARAMRGTVSQAIRDPAGFGANSAAVNDYFAKYYFPKMTGTTPESLAELGDMRKELFSRYIRATPNADSQATLTSLSLKGATAFSRGNYHPAVRYNAALILGNLDQKTAGKGANATPPIPLPAATAALLDLLEQEDFGGVKVHPSVQLGALVGLERHASFGIAPQHAQRVTKAVLDVMAQENPPEEVSKDVHHWMRCRAANVLAYQHREKPNAEAQTALNALMSNEKLDLENRCFVAGLLELLDYTQAAEIDSAAILAALGGLSQDVLKTESKLASEYQQKVLGGGLNLPRNLFGGGGGARGGGRGGARGGGRGGARGGGLAGGLGGGDQAKIERRQLLSRLRAIYNGANSLAEGAPDATKSQLQDLLDAMKPAQDAAADKGATDLEVAEKVLQAAQDVDQVIQSWKQGAAPAEPVEADFS